MVDKLFHNMRMKGIPAQIVDWYKKRLERRRTTLSFDNFISEPFNVQMGLDQGCPISPIAFLFYNTDLIDTAFAARGKSQEEANKKLKVIMEKDNGALAWGKEHRADFELDKTALLCVTRGRVPDPNNRGKSILAPRPPITIQGHHIEPSKAVKFLGIIIDDKLQFKEHAAYTIAKGTKYVLACNRMTKVSKGVRGTVMKRLYEAVAVPKMLYTVDIWGTELLRKERGKREKGWGARGFAKQIDKVQRLAMILITGAMRSTATDVLIAHTDCLPTILLIRKLCHRSTLQLATLPNNHPLAKHIKGVYRNQKRHKSPLHRLLEHLDVHPPTMEKILPVRHHPKWQPETTVQISDDPQKVARQDEKAEEEDNICVYTDGSGQDGKIGVAAVLRRKGTTIKTIKYHLGSDKNHMVYEAEVVGMLLAMELLRGERGARKVSLGINNQAAILALKALKSGSGHYLMDWFHKSL